LLEAYRLGCLYDSWSDEFDNEKWMQAFENTGVDLEFYTMRKRDLDELFPWDFIDVGVSKSFLKREWERAMKGEVTPNCRERCSRSEEHTSELQSRFDLVCRLLLEK